MARTNMYTAGTTTRREGMWRRTHQTSHVSTRFLRRLAMGDLVAVDHLQTHRGVWTWAFHAQTGMQNGRRWTMYRKQYDSQKMPLKLYQDTIGAVQKWRHRENEIFGPPPLLVTICHYFGLAPSPPCHRCKQWKTIKIMWKLRKYRRFYGDVTTCQ